MKTSAITNPQIAEEAADWAVRIDCGPLHFEERKSLALWLTISPTHVSELVLSCALIAGLEQVDGDKTLSTRALLEQSAPEVVSLFDSAQELASTQTAGTASNDSANANPARRFPSMRQGAVAASLAIALFAGVAGYSGGNFSSLEMLADRSAQQLNDERDPSLYSTQIGEQRSIVLEDGSIVFMNTNSQMRATISETGRRIDLLQGEAMFEVAHDPDRPFRVFAHGSMAQAVGTKFNVETTEKGINVVVVEGRVLVQNKAHETRLHRAKIRTKNLDSAAADDLNTDLNTDSDTNAPVLLTAGDQAHLEQALARPQITSANIAAVTSWRMRQLLFEHEELADIAREFNRYNRKKIVLSDDSIADLRFSGLFSADDPDSFIEFLTLTAGVAVDRSQPDQTTIRPSAN